MVKYFSENNHARLGLLPELICDSLCNDKALPAHAANDYAELCATVTNQASWAATAEFFDALQTSFGKMLQAPSTMSPVEFAVGLADRGVGQTEFFEFVEELFGQVESVDPNAPVPPHRKAQAAASPPPLIQLGVLRTLVIEALKKRNLKKDKVVEGWRQRLKDIVAKHEDF